MWFMNPYRFRITTVCVHSIEHCFHDSIIFIRQVYCIKVENLADSHKYQCSKFKIAHKSQFWCNYFLPQKKKKNNFHKTFIFTKNASKSTWKFNEIIIEWAMAHSILDWLVTLAKCLTIIIWYNKKSPSKSMIDKIYASLF